MACGFSSLAITGTSLRGAAMICFDHADVGGGAHEGNRDRIDTVLEPEFEVFAVFFGKRGNREGDARAD